MWLMAMATLGLVLVVMANDRAVLYLGIEFQSRAVYTRAAYARGSAYATEAGVKYFVQGAFASVLLLVGRLLVYVSYGTTHYAALERRTSGASASTSALTSGLSSGLASTHVPLDGSLLSDTVAAFLPYTGVARRRSGLRFKRGVAPFHVWVADVYDGVPRATALYLATVPKLGRAVATAILVWGPFHHRDVTPVRLVAALLSVAIGAIAVVPQVRWTRYLAYSSIGHGGYRRAGRACGSWIGIQSTVTYGIVYTVTSFLGWILRVTATRSVYPSAAPFAANVAANVAAHATASGSGSHANTNSGTGRPRAYLSELAGFSRVNPVRAFTRRVVLMSMAGIPPLAGFAAKRAVLTALVQSHRTLRAVLMRVLSIVACYNYLRRVKIAYMEPTADTGMTYPVVTTSVATAYTVARGALVRRRYMLIPDARDVVRARRTAR